MAISGIFVSLQTSSASDSGTDDEIYLGIWGRGAGGREFPLSVKSYEDFDTGLGTNYVLGLDLGFGVKTQHPDRSRPGENNDPARLPIELHGVEYVYLRKQAYGQDRDDDAWQLGSVFVRMYDAESLPLQRNQYRDFVLDTRHGLWLGNEFGHQVWLVGLGVIFDQVGELRTKVDKAFG